MRRLIRTHLKQTCIVIEAADGAQGYDKAMAEIPDLIICDVMMPKMDGMQLCRQLKNDERTSHIPVILLTALARQENKLQGLETGADDYLVKPFETAELSLRVRNLIENRRKLYQRLTIPGLRSPSAKDSKDQSIVRLAAIVNDHLSEETFGVNDLAAAIGWSRRQLYRKLKAVVNQTPERFIYVVKLEFARQQLQTTARSISEIAFQAGFSSPAHFSKLFREYYRVTPRGYRKMVGEKAPVGGKVKKM